MVLTFALNGASSSRPAGTAQRPSGDGTAHATPDSLSSRPVASFFDMRLHGLAGAHRVPFIVQNRFVERPVGRFGGRASMRSCSAMDVAGCAKSAAKPSRAACSAYLRVCSDALAVHRV
jgi:hypothetical protein